MSTRGIQQWVGEFWMIQWVVIWLLWKRVGSGRCTPHFTDWSQRQETGPTSGTPSCQRLRRWSKWMGRKKPCCCVHSGMRTFGRWRSWVRRRWSATWRSTSTTWWSLRNLWLRRWLRWLGVNGPHRSRSMPQTHLWDFWGWIWKR